MSRAAARAAEWRLAERAGGLFAQLFFIAAGVYLGNRADAWKEERAHREAALTTLTNLRGEMARNRDALTKRQQYHTQLRDAFFALAQRPAPPRTLDELFHAVHFQGLRPPTFRHAAWDLALANQSLGYLAPPLAFAVADVYEDQHDLEQYGANTVQSVVNPAALQQQNPAPLGMTITAYLVDVATYQEPEVLGGYRRLLPRLDSAIARLRR